MPDTALTDLQTRLSDEIAARRDDLTALTQDLIRIPTLNPPGENYREICDFLDRRLLRSGFHTELIRAVGSPGDSEKYPRWNIVARREGNRLIAETELMQMNGQPFALDRSGLRLTVLGADRAVDIQGCPAR